MIFLKITYRLGIVVSVALSSLSCNQIDLDLPSSRESLILCGNSGEDSLLLRSGETVFQERLGEDLWITATVSDNPVSCFPAEPTDRPEYDSNWYCWAPDGIATPNQNDKAFIYSTPSTKTCDDTDILVAPVKNVVSSKNSTLDITLKHALCEVKFVPDITMPTDLLKSISISGINLTGTYDFVSESWTDQNNCGDITLSDISKNVYGCTDKGLGDDSQSQTLFVIPQTLPQSTTAQLIVEYQGKTPVAVPLPPGFDFPSGKTLTFSLRKSSYDFVLVQQGDNVQTFDDFKNETEIITHLIPIKSVFYAGDEKYADWEIESYRIGTAAAVNVNGTTFTAGGYTVSKSGAKTLSVTSGIRTAEALGDHAHWTTPSLTGDFDGKGWSPEDWSKGHTFNDGKTYGSPLNPIDLSKFNFTTENINPTMYTANTYIIRHAGTYKLPLVYGNAIFDDDTDYNSFLPKIPINTDGGLLEFVDCSGEVINNPFIENNEVVPTGAAVIWQSQDNVIKDIRIVGDKAKHGEHYSPLNKPGFVTVRYLQFTVDPNTICQNNALVCVYRDKDGDNSYDEGEAIWSWHIWITNDPALLDKPIPVTNFNNITYDFFPLYALGWTEGQFCPMREPVQTVLRQKESGKRIVIDLNSPELRHVGSCTYYQYGRKDPMLDVNSAPARGHYTILRQCARSIGEAISNPATFYASSYNDWCLDTYNNLWTGKYNLVSGAVDQDIDMIKTIYDPSPLGYKVPASMAFAAFTSATSRAGAASSNNWNLAGPNYDFGWNFNTGNNSSIYFPASGYVSQSGGYIKGNGILARYTSICLENDKSTGYENGVVCFDFSKHSVNPYHDSYRSDGLALRPVSDSDPGHHFHY